MGVRTSAVLEHLDEEVPVADEVVTGFARDGHALVRGLASAEDVAHLRPRIEALTEATARNRHEMPAPGRFDGVFLQAFNLWRLDEDVRRFVLARRFAAVAAALLGVPRVRLYHDQSLCKGPGFGRTPWHQDQDYWPLDTDRTVTMWMPMVPVPEEAGGMAFASGSHRLGSLCGSGISRDGDRSLSEEIERRGLPVTTYGTLEPGDATFHTGWTVHSAGRNHTDELRTVMTVIYFADGARVTEPTPQQELDRQAWLGGREPGALADHELNPVLCGSVR